MKVEIQNGEDIIQLLYDGFASCLVIKKALTVNWPDCAGSVGEYYGLSSHSSQERKALTQELNQVLVKDGENEIFKAVEQFLKLFSDGEYEVNLSEIELHKAIFFHETQTGNSNTVTEDKSFAGWFYPFPEEERYYFFTIPNESIDLERVTYYKDIIQSGLKPKVVTLELYKKSSFNSTACYILDGHHKIKAYQALGLDIPRVRIVKFEQEKESTQEVLRASSTILQNFEFQHLLSTTYDGLHSFDFAADKILTARLDEILNENSYLGFGVVELLMAMDKSDDPFHFDWLTARLKVLSKNEHIGRDLNLRSFGYSERYKCDCWTIEEINDLSHLDNWIKKTLHHKDYLIIGV